MIFGLASFLIGIQCCFSQMPLVGNPSEKPNIILIMSDDQGSAQFGFMADSFRRDQLNNYSLEKAFYGSNAYDPLKSLEAAKKCTPHLDRLRHEGMLLTHFHVGPSCAPTRAALLTARYPQRWGGYTNRDLEIVGIGNESLPVRDLQQAGYATACIGKWHAAPLEEQHPLDYGFDYFWGFGRSHTPYHKSPHLVKNREKISAQGYLTEEITREALSFIDRSCENKEPFFLYLPYNAPHSSTHSTPKQYYSKFDTGSLVMDKVYGAIYAMDLGIGKIVDKLAEQGIEKNTLVLFTVDNGCPYWFPVPGNGMLAGFKRQLSEGGVRTPLVAWWPEMIEPMSLDDGLASCMDLMPTALAAAGVESAKQLDGISLLETLKDKGEIPLQRALFWAGSHGQGTEEARFYMAGLAKKNGHFTDWYTPAGWYAIKGKWKLISPGTGWVKLFDLQNDPGETKDVAGEHPEKAEELSVLFSEWLKDKPKPVAWDAGKWKKMRKLNRIGED